MKKSKVTRSLLAACSIVALSAVMYGCVHSGGGDTPPSMEEPDPDPVADLNAAISAEAAARMAVAGLSATSSDAAVMDARTKLAAAQTAVMKLADDHALRASVAQLATDLQGVETARTVASQLMTVNNAHDMAKMAVDELDRAGSTADAVAEARTKVNAAQAALNAATALSEEQRTSLGSMIMAVDDALDGIEAYRATDAGQLAVAEAAVDAAEGLVDALTDESTPAEAGDAYAALQRAKQAVAAAADLPDNVRTRLNAKIDELEKQATGQSSITLALAEATTAVNSLSADSTDDDVAAARTKVNEAKTAAAALEDDDARKMAIAALDTNLMGIEQARTDEGNKPGLDANAMALVAAIDGETLPLMPDTMSLDSMTGMPPLTGDMNFTMSTMSIGSIDGWMGNAYSRANKAVPDDRATPDTNEAKVASDDTVVVYNNKGADEEVAYVGHFDAIDGRTVTPATGVLEVVKDATTSVITDMVTFARTGSIISLTASGDDSSVEGTFHGLSGTFSCGAECTINRLSDGKYSTAGTLTFTPTLDTSDGAATPTAQVANLTIMIPDPDYMHFGYWKNASMNEKGEPVYMVNAFSGGTDASTLATVQGRLGSAKYAGKASGLYVRKEVDSGGDPQHLYHGQFIADASLTASFGGGSVAADDHYSIKGEITNFMNGDDPIDPTWSVTLMKTGFNASGETNEGTFDTANTDMFIGGDTEGDKGMMGSWSGQFFGETAAVANDPDTTADETLTGLLPTGVAGEFNGHFVNGHALGAFGADMMDE